MIIRYIVFGWAPPGAGGKPSRKRHHRIVAAGCTVASMSNEGQRRRRLEQILTEIHRTRDELEKTLIAIEHRLTPGQLVDHGIDYLRYSGANEFVQNLGGAAKQTRCRWRLSRIGLALAHGPRPAAGAARGLVDTDFRSARQRHRSHAEASKRSRRPRNVSAKQQPGERWAQCREGASVTDRQRPRAVAAGARRRGLPRTSSRWSLGRSVSPSARCWAAPLRGKSRQLLGRASRSVTKGEGLGSEQLEKARTGFQEVARFAQRRARSRSRSGIKAAPFECDRARGKASESATVGGRDRRRGREASAPREIPRVAGWTSRAG